MKTGDRVKVIQGPDEDTGKVGTVIRNTSTAPFPVLVKLDDYRSPFSYDEDELEVIE